MGEEGRGWPWGATQDQAAAACAGSTRVPWCGQDPTSALPALAPPPPQLRPAWPLLGPSRPTQLCRVSSCLCGAPQVADAADPAGSLQRWPPGDRPQPRFSRGILSRCPAGRLGSGVPVPPGPGASTGCARAPRQCPRHTSQWRRVPPPTPHRGGCHSRTRVPGHRRPHTQAPGTCSPLRQCRAPPWMTKPHHTCPCGHHVADANIFQKPKAQRTELSILKPLDLNSTPPSGLTPLPRVGRGSWTEACGCVLGVHTSCV